MAVPGLDTRVPTLRVHLAHRVRSREGEFTPTERISGSPGETRTRDPQVRSLVVSLPKPEIQPLGQLPFYELLCEGLREGQHLGEIRAGDVEEMAQLLWDGLHGALGLPTNVDGYAIHPSEECAPAMILALMRSIEA
jgi:hypothetical protein